MAIQELRDSKNALLGTIHTLSNGRLEIRNAKYQSKGIYDPKTNETRNSSNSLVGKGNLLATLL